MGRGNGRELTWGLVFPFTALLISLPTLSRRKPCLCYLIDFPGFACVLGLNKCSLLHFCISGLPPPPFHSWRSIWRVKTMIVAFNLCGQHMDLQLPYAALSKHRAGLMELSLNNNLSLSCSFWCSTNFPKSRREQRWHVPFAKSLCKKEKSEDDEKDSVT